MAGTVVAGAVVIEIGGIMLSPRELHRIGGGSVYRRGPEWTVGVGGRHRAAVVRQSQGGAQMVGQVELVTGGGLPDQGLINIERAEIPGIRRPELAEQICPIILIGGRHPVDRLGDPPIEGVVLETRGEIRPGNPRYRSEQDEATSYPRG